MELLPLHAWHRDHQARFLDLNGMEAVADYSNPAAEHVWLTETAAMLDLSCRSRLCLTGSERLRFLHGQVTNDINRLQIGQGCYAALITAKGKMISDLNVFRLQDELLLDFEPGLAQLVAQRLEQYIIADDVQLNDVGPQYGLLSVQGPKAGDALKQPGLFPNRQVELPTTALSFVTLEHQSDGIIYLVNQSRLGSEGYDLFVPAPSLARIAERLFQAAQAVGGGSAGWTAFDIARIEAGVPRFGVDMNESNLPPETGLEARAISYSKGCYIGQEVIARIRTYGQVAKSLRRLQFAPDLAQLPKSGEKLCKEGKEVGYVTSSTRSPRLPNPIGLGYVRREANAIGTELSWQTESGESPVRIVGLPLPENFT